MIFLGFLEIILRKNNLRENQNISFLKEFHLKTIEAIMPDIGNVDLF